MAQPALWAVMVALAAAWQAAGVAPEAVVGYDGRNPAGYPVRWEADITKMRGLGFTPRMPLEAGVAEYVDWFKGL